MAHKRVRKDLRTLDRNTAEYWNEVLRREGLTMDAGRNPKLIYVGTGADVELIEGIRRTDDGRTLPKPTGWPEDE